MNKRGKLGDMTDLFKAVITGIIGIIFLTALAPIVSQSISESFIGLGVFLIIIAIIVAFLSVIMNFFGNNRFY